MVVYLDVVAFLVVPAPSLNPTDGCRPSTDDVNGATCLPKAEKSQDTHTIKILKSAHEPYNTKKNKTISIRKLIQRATSMHTFPKTQDLPINSG